ncbi:MAG: hypothetical protein SO181_03605 [Frisingicoccus sp.]|uniref:hypothetical protein n=1 Tax=Frisingicoccus sp. TaxID=1918627 RepID=UPI002A83FEEC|nr:hypothetical protein [Frisingicoccus sp.]MDY4834220.1 hypothetical protein [Frisingicoccus sp.]
MLKKLKRELIGAAVSVMISAVALSSATYAWYVTNNTVQATTTTISATTNGFILQIAKAEDGAQHGGEQMSLAASNVGGKITPSSTNDLKDWYICQGWGSDGRVTTYTKPTFATGTGAKPGQYEAGGETHYAYIRSEYILYTITESGLADVYLDASEGSPISVSVDNGKTATFTTIPDSMRIAITTQTLDTDGKTPTDDETLRIVYAPKAVTGSGNDSQAIEGKWTYINVDKPAEVTYSHIHDTTYTDQNNKNWAATKSGEDYTVTEGSEAIATNVGYNGIMLRVYIWMEGTDADCVNNAAAEDEATYSVTVKLAGVAS